MTCSCQYVPTSLVAGEIGALILCHTRELAYQICHEFERFSAYLPNVNVSVIFGGVNLKTQKEELQAGAYTDSHFRST